jgi:hypothetical protein
MYFSGMSFLLQREGLPVRCEICHQSDCFNPQDNFCSRCHARNGVIVRTPEELKAPPPFSTTPAPPESPVTLKKAPPRQPLPDLGQEIRRMTRRNNDLFSGGTSLTVADRKLLRNIVISVFAIYALFTFLAFCFGFWPLG